MNADRHSPDSPPPRAPVPNRWLSLVLLTLGSTTCALFNLEFESCILLVGFLTTELSTWPTA